MMKMAIMMMMKMIIITCTKEKDKEREKDPAHELRVDHPAMTFILIWSFLLVSFVSVLLYLFLCLFVNFQCNKI